MYPLVTRTLHLIYRPAVSLTHADAFNSMPVESSGPNAVAVGWIDTPGDEDPWGAFEDPAPPPVLYQSS